MSFYYLALNISKKHLLTWIFCPFPTSMNKLSVFLWLTTPLTPLTFPLTLTSSTLFLTLSALSILSTAIFLALAVFFSPFTNTSFWSFPICLVALIFFLEFFALISLYVSLLETAEYLAFLRCSMSKRGCSDFLCACPILPTLWYLTTGLCTCTMNSTLAFPVPSHSQLEHLSLMSEIWLNFPHNQQRNTAWNWLLHSCIF